MIIFEDARDNAGNKVDNYKYFLNKEIYNAGDQYLQHLGRYPVITLSLKSAKQLTFESAYHRICGEIADEYRRHAYVLASDVLDEEEKEMFNLIMNKEATYDDYSVALKSLSHYLERYHGQKVLVLIDEYDVPLQTAHYEKFYKAMIYFIGSLFESVLKTNDSLFFGVVTGCLLKPAENIWSFLLFTGYLKRGTKRKIGTVGDCDTMTLFLNRQLHRTISYLDSAENFYHGFLLGILHSISDYDIKSNREAGDGRPDVVLKDMLHYRYGIVFELKVASKFSEMEAKCNEALKQIENRHYDYDLQEEGYTHIQKYGICFLKKRCLVKKPSR